MSDALKKRQEQLITRGLGTGLPFFPGLPSFDSAGLRFDPPKRKIGEISQGILSAIEKGAKLTDKALTYPAELGESAVEYLLSPSEFAKQQEQEKKDSITKSLSLDELFYPSGDFRENERKIAEAQGMRFDPVDLTKKIKNLIAPSGVEDSSEAQKIIAEKESLETSKKNQEATAEGKAIFDAKQQMRGAESDSLNKLFEQSMEDYLTNVRGVGPEARTKDLEEYKREFAEATGIDISGKVDKSMALASFGLALMQNRAGKGFNVGRMLSSVGEAGEAAMPALEKAKTRARNDAIAAGKYALETRASDRATDAVNREKSFNRPGYYIFERGKDIEDGNKKFNEGKIVYLNGEEINKLITDKDFDKRFSFIKKSEYLDIKKELTKPVERGEMWVKGDPNNFSLIGGDSKDVPPALQVLAHNKNPNYEGETPSSKLLAENEDDVKARFVRYQEEVLKNKEKLTELVSLLQEGISIPKQISGKVQQLAKSMGVNVDTSSPAAAQQALQNIAIDNVLEILKESGRTISEGERQRVDKRVGNVAMNLKGSDLDLVLNQVEYVYDMVVNTPQKNLNDALDSFENQFGYSIMDNATEEEKITQDELDLINENRKAQGLEPRTMDNFK